MVTKKKVCRCPVPRLSRRTEAQERLYEMGRQHAIADEQTRKDRREQCPMCRNPMHIGAEFGAPFANEATCPTCGWKGVIIG